MAGHINGGGGSLLGRKRTWLGPGRVSDFVQPPGKKLARTAEHVKKGP